MDKMTSQSRLFLFLVFFVMACRAGRRVEPQAVPSTPPPVSSAQPPNPPPVDIVSAPASLPPLPPVCEDATSTTNPLGRLRNAMRNSTFTQKSNPYDAFLIFYSDEHLSEEPAAEERRLEYISGWSGAGTGVVMADGGAAAWVPAGELRRARATLSCAWLVFDADNLSRPTIAGWIAERLGRPGRVGADARLTSIDEWQALVLALQRESLQLVNMPSVVDQLWNEEPEPARRRPEFSKIVANLHNEQYTGVFWRDKVAGVRNELVSMGAEAMVVTALDEVAWLLNVRGRDLPYAPLLKAFVIVSTREVRVYAQPGKLSMPLREALAVYNCHQSNNNCTRVMEYVNIYTDLRRATESKILIPTGGTFQRGASAAIVQSVVASKRMFQMSPIIYMKAQKSAAEVTGMRKAHLRDAVAMCTLLSYIEEKIKQELNETSVAEKVDITRGTQASYVSLSMRTRVAFGPNGADPDYSATALSNRRVFRNSTLIIQSGGQYEEGTTVVTRTLHYGTPSSEERRAYTSTLRALTALSTLQLPATLPAAHTDPVARAPLWAAKQDYPHPTGHGVGAALNRKEDPVVLDYRQDTNLHTLKEGYFITSEPAWYETNKFGVRLGNILEIVSKPDGFLGFREATLVPFELKLIDKSSLTEYEVNWLNAYNKRIRTVVGPELTAQGLTKVYYWMMNKTLPVEMPTKAKNNPSSEAVKTQSMMLMFALGLATLSLL